MENKTCGECQWYDYHHLLCVVGGDVKPVDCACDSFIPIKRTNGDVIRHDGNRDFAEYFVYETGAVFASTLIVDKTFDTYDEAVDATMEYLNAPEESEGDDEP